MRNYDAILNMWAAGVPTKEINQRLGYKASICSAGQLRKVLMAAREAKDARAIRFHDRHHALQNRRERYRRTLSIRSC